MRRITISSVISSRPPTVTGLECVDGLPTPPGKPGQALGQ